MRVGTNILVHPDTTGPGKFGRRLARALVNENIELLPGPCSSVFLASSILEPPEYHYTNSMKIIHRVDNTGELYPWDGKHWTPDTKNVQYVYEKATRHIFQTEWSAQQFALHPELYSKPKDYQVIFNGVPLMPLDDKPRGDGIFVAISNTWNPTRMYGYLKFLFPYLKDILDNVPNLKIQFVGKIEPVISEVYNHGLESYIAKRILFVSFPADLDLVRSKADGFIHFTYHDSCPNSVVESVMSSLPGITLNTGASELIGDAGFSFNQPTSFELIEAFNQILNNNTEYRQRVHKFASQNLDITQVAKQYANILRECA